MSWDYSGNLKPSSPVSNPFTIRACYKALMVGLVSLTACAPSDPNKIHLFNEIYFNLQAREQLVPPSQGHIKTFQQALSVFNIQVPLFKVVKGPGYYLYLGKPITSLVAILDSSTTEWEAMQSSDSIFYAQWKKVPQSQALYYVDTPSKFLLLALQDSTTASSVQSFQNLASRIEFKN